MRSRYHTACHVTISVVTLLVLGTGCARVPSEPADVTPLVTDRSSYAATYEGGDGTYRRYGFTVIARYTNSSSAPVYLGRCYPTSPHPSVGVALVEASGTGRESAYSPIYACVGHDQQIVVSPGAVRTDTLHLVGPNAYNGITKEPYGVLAGPMRLSYQVSACPGDGGCAGTAPSRQYSNAFEVVQAP